MRLNSQDIMRVPPVASVCPPNEYESFESQQVASDCMWSDPAKDDQVRGDTLGTKAGVMYYSLACGMQQYIPRCCYLRCVWDPM